MLLEYKGCKSLVPVKKEVKLGWKDDRPPHFKRRCGRKESIMTANDLIQEAVHPKYQERAHVRALIEDKDSWFHVHKDEELPDNYRVVVYIRA